MKFEKVKKLSEDIDIEKTVFTQTPDDEVSYDTTDAIESLVEENNIVITGNRDFIEFGDEELIDIIKGDYEDDEYGYDYKVLDELAKVSGKNYVENTIRGYSQGDWQNIYYPVGTNPEIIEEIEMYYFDKYDEFKSSDEIIIVPHDITWKGANIVKKYISDLTGIDVNNIALKKFDKYEKVPVYSDFTEGFNKKYANPLKDIRSNTLVFPSQDYVYVEYEDGKLYAGGATNAGLFHDYEIDYDWDLSVDANIQNLYDKIIKEHPEFMDDPADVTEGFKRYKITEALEDYDGYIDMFANENINEKFDVEDVERDDLTQKEFDLYVFIDNDEETYKRYLLPNLLNLAKWVGRGKFDANLAIKELKNVINSALPSYKKRNNIGYTFSDVEKTRIAKVLFTHYKDEIEGLDDIDESLTHVERGNSYDNEEQNETDNSVDNFQKLVDYDMKNYHRVSKETWDKLRDAGLTMVKDVHGDYEVISHED